MTKCNYSPGPNWHGCQREAGHTGPCAHEPVGLDLPATVLKATTFTDFRQVAARIWADPAMTSYVLSPQLVDSIAFKLITTCVPEFIMEPCDGGDCGRHGADCEACDNNEKRRLKLKEQGYATR